MTTAAAPPAPTPAHLRDLAEAASYVHQPGIEKTVPLMSGRGTVQARYCVWCEEDWPCTTAVLAAALRAAATTIERLAKIETAANGVARYWGGGGPGMRYTSSAWTPDFAEAMTALKAALLAAPSDQEPTR